MKKIIISFMAMLTILFTVSACAKEKTNTNEETTQESQTPLFIESSHDNQAMTTEPEFDEAQITKQLSDQYLDIANFPVLDIDIEESYVFDDRSISLEDSIDNELELLAYYYYYYSSSGESDKLKDLFGDNESLRMAVSNEVTNFKEGIYKSEYIIHRLTTLTIEDLLSISTSYKKEILNKVISFDFDKYAVVSVDVSWKHNETSLRRGPQLGDGSYTRYYLIANTQDNSEFKIYEVYWEDFLS